MAMMMHKYSCQFCGTTLMDESSWTLHQNSCFTRTTTCSLCGLTMPSMHSDEHLRVMHRIDTGRRSRPPARLGAFVDATHVDHSRDNGNNNNNDNNNIIVTPRRSTVMASALQIRPVIDASSSPSLSSSSRAARAAARSPALSRLAAQSGIHGFESKGRDGGMMEMILGQQQQQPQTAALTPAVGDREGFSFKSDGQLLRQAGTPERVRKQQQQQQQQQQRKPERQPTENDASSFSSVGSVSAATRAADRVRLQLVEDVVYNIVSVSPQKRQIPGGGSQSTATAEKDAEADAYRRHGFDQSANNNRGAAAAAAAAMMQLLRSRSPAAAAAAALRSSSASSSSTARTPSLSLLGAAAASRGLPRPTAVIAVNEGMSACPDCGKAIFSQSQHHCPAQFTECPKCFKRVALLTFDRHFLECAVPSWATTRERREQERLVQRNAASFRASRSSASLLCGVSGFRALGSSSSASGLLMMENVEKSHVFTDDVTRLLGPHNGDNDDDDHDDKMIIDATEFCGRGVSKTDLDDDVDDDDDLSNNSSSHLLSVEKHERRERISEQRRQETKAQQQQEKLCPPGHRLCVLCCKPVPETDMPAHLDKCDSNLLSCPLCLEGIPAHELEPHQLTCPANRRRCFSCGTSIQFSRLPDHVAHCCTTGVQMTMYHGTEERAAREIIKNGFLPSANGLLGEGVYMSQNVAKARNYGPVIIEAVVTIPSGRVLTVPSIGHRLQKSWQRAGYDAAWMPPGVSKSGLEEHCIKNPKFIVVKGLVGRE